MIPPKGFDIFPPNYYIYWGCSEGLDAFNFFAKISTYHAANSLKEIRTGAVME